MTRAARAAGAGTLLAATLALMAADAPARAHAVGVSSGEYRLEGATLYGDLGLADRELARWQPAIDTDYDGAISPDELATARETVRLGLMRGLTVAADGHPCPGRWTGPG
jgi:hypothetical protein